MSEINAADYAKEFIIDNNGEANQRKSIDNKDLFRKLYESGIEDAKAQYDNNEKKAIGISYERDFIKYFQKFLIYTSGISVGIIMVNLLFLLIIGDASLSKVAANVIAALTMLIINERIK